MFYIGLVFLLAISNQLVHGLICATNCTFTTRLDNITIPSCNVIDKPSTEQSCHAELTINYTSGSIVGTLHPIKLPFNFDLYMVSSFSLNDNTTYVLVGLACFTNDNCDQEFVKETLNINWIRIQSQANALRENLANLLFNSSDLRPNDTCSKNQTCSDKGFCQVDYKLEIDGTKQQFSSKCANSTEYPQLTWAQLYTQDYSWNELFYVSNKPSLGNETFANAIVELLKVNYNIPVNVTVPPTTTTIRSSTASTITGQTTLPSTMSTPMSNTTKSMAALINVDQTQKVLFGFISLLLFCFFDI